VNIAVIPARGGSKRIPRKNIKKFAGKPMLQYAIEAAQVADVFDEIVVSTDDNEIAEIAKALGASVPFSRPANLSDDHTPTVPVIRHAIEQMHRMEENVSFVCCIYPTVPFIRSSDLVEALAKVKDNSDRFCFPVAEFPSSIFRSLKMSENCALESVFPEHELTRSQDLPPAFFDVGQFYWGHSDLWKQSDTVLSLGIGHEIPYWRAIDIDTTADWQRAELLYGTL
jgi:pseudaminic acid cytidylyltransferase